MAIFKNLNTFTKQFLNLHILTQITLTAKILPNLWYKVPPTLLIKLVQKRRTKMDKFKVKVECEIAEIIDTPDNEKRMGTYPETQLAILNAPTCDIATALVLGALAETYSERGKYFLIKNTYVQHTCFKLLSLLDSTGYDTSWIRYIWNLQGISDLWCAKRCVEIINNNEIMIPAKLDVPELLFVLEGE